MELSNYDKVCISNSGLLAEVERLKRLNAELVAALVGMPFDCPYCGTCSATVGKSFHADDCPIGIALAKHKE